MKTQINHGIAPAPWPYPIKYDTETRVETDVLVIGAGVAGSMAGIRAARRGVKVAVVDKVPIDVSGSGGMGLDHYLGCTSNPACKFTPEQFMDMPPQPGDEMFVPGDHCKYIQMKESWDNLLELEKLGLHFRDEDDEFQGAAFRDDDSKIMYAYDYATRDTVRLRGGAHFKKVMREGLMKEEKVKLFERVMITTLLTEDGKSGHRIVGATGIHEETGEFFVFSAKCVILSTGGLACQCTGTWTFNSEMFGNGFRADPRDTGDGFAMAWTAGADFHRETEFGQTLYTGPFGWPWYGIGNPHNTWHGCTLVDNKGTEIPYVDGLGQPISTMEERWLPENGRLTISKLRPAPFIDPAKIEDGTYELPLWADLSALPEKERRGIWGLMVGNEGRTRLGIYDYYAKSGFNPETDLLQVPNMSPENFGRHRKDWFQGEPNNNKFWKADTLRGCVVDWNQMCSVPGLFACGMDSSQGGASCGSAGGYAGNRAAEYALETDRGPLCEQQIAQEKDRVYGPVRRFGKPGAVIGWKELWMGLNRVMQQDCGDVKNVATATHGLMWLDSIKQHEMQLTYARNPHELVRVLENMNRITVGEIYLWLCLANFKAEEDGISEDKVMFSRLEDGKLVNTYREQKWWLKPPYAPTYLENYKRCTAKEKEGK